MLCPDAVPGCRARTLCRDRPGIDVEGVDTIQRDETGAIADVTAMIRPLKAVDLVHWRVAAIPLARG